MTSRINEKCLVQMRIKIEEKLTSLQEHQEVLLSLINDYVSQTQLAAKNWLSFSDRYAMLNNYIDVVQKLDCCINNCLLLGATIEPMMDSEKMEDAMVKSKGAELDFKDTSNSSKECHSLDKCMAVPEMRQSSPQTQKLLQTMLADTSIKNEGHNRWRCSSGKYEQQENSTFHLETSSHTATTRQREDSFVFRMAEEIHGYGLGPFIPKLEEMPKSTVEVIVSEIGTPWSFFIQLYGPALEDLREQINSYVKLRAGKSLCHIQHPVEGMVCLAIYPQDMLLYRARVTKVIGVDSDVVVEVFYVDYGNKLQLSQSQLYQLPPKLALLPAQAVECGLAGVAPVNQHLGVWTEEEVIAFTQFVCSRRLSCKFVYFSNTDSLHPHLVHLHICITMSSMIKTEDSIFLNLAQMLIKHNSARSVSVVEQMELMTECSVAEVPLSRNMTSNENTGSTLCVSDMKHLR